MNDYSRGVFDAVGWASKISKRTDNVLQIRRTLDEALDRMMSGSALEFAEHIKELPF